MYPAGLLLPRGGVFKRLQMRQIVVLFMASGFRQLEFLAAERKRNCPRPGVHHRVGHGGLVGYGVRSRRRESLHDVLGITHDLPTFVKPSLAIEVRGIDDQGVPFPVAHRVTLPEPDGWGQVGAAVQADDAPGRALLENHDGIGGLDDLHCGWYVHRARHTGREAVSRGIVVTAFRAVAVLQFGHSPRPHRKLAIWWIDDYSAAAWRKPITSVLFQAVVGASAAGCRHIEPLKIRLSSRRAADIGGGLWRSGRRGRGSRRSHWGSRCSITRIP